MKATRFSMTLYISMPVVASACSVVMIAHFITLVQNGIEGGGLYGDALTYIALAESFHFFSDEIITFRLITPLISGAIAELFSLTGKESVGLLTGTLNFGYLLIGFGWMYYLSMKESANNSLEVALPTFLVMTLPGFWQGVFLPVPDALMFCMFGLILTGVLRQRLDILLPSILAGVFVSEWLFLAVLLLPLADYLRGSVWNRGYWAVGLAVVAYLAVPLLTQIPDAHLIYRPGEWLDGAREQFLARDTSVLQAFLRSFALTLPFFAYRFYVGGWNRVTDRNRVTSPNRGTRRNRVTGTLSVWFLVVFMVTYLLAPDSANRIMFMTMPALVLWQYQSDTFQNMNRPINREAEARMG